MLNIRTIYRPRRTAEYYLRVAEGRGLGVWMGSACKLLGLREGAPVTRRELLLALDGYNVEGKAVIHHLQARRRCGYDVVLSATKSVSVGAVRGEASLSRRITGIFQKQVRRFVKWLEELSRSRGRSALGTPLAVAGFVHTDSRLGDEHLHAHFLTMNVTGGDGEGRAIDMRACFKAHLALERRFQQELRQRLNRAGIAAFLDENGRAALNISATECKKRSRMKEQIDAVTSRWQLEGENKYKLREIVADRLAKFARRSGQDPLIVTWAELGDKCEIPRRSVRRVKAQRRNQWGRALERLKTDPRSDVLDLWFRRGVTAQRRMAWMQFRKRFVAAVPPRQRSMQETKAQLKKSVHKKQRMRKELQKEIKRTSPKTI